MGAPRHHRHVIALDRGPSELRPVSGFVFLVVQLRLRTTRILLPLGRFSLPVSLLGLKKPS